MRRFEHGGKPYIDINGKVFFLIRGFGDSRYKPSTDFVFVQVTGRYALSKTDLPNDNWRVIRTKGNAAACVSSLVRRSECSALS